MFELQVDSLFQGGTFHCVICTWRGHSCIEARGERCIRFWTGFHV